MGGKLVCCYADPFREHGYSKNAGPEGPDWRKMENLLADRCEKHERQGRKSGHGAVFPERVVVPGGDGGRQAGDRLLAAGGRSIHR